jgi:hypothetical protein
VKEMDKPQFTVMGSLDWFLSQAAPAISVQVGTFKAQDAGQ